MPTPSHTTSENTWLYLAREVAISKWRKAIDTGNQVDIADAIDNDLCPAQGSLSFWQTDGTEIDVRFIATAVAAASTYPDRVDITVIPAADVAAIGVAIERAAGRTPLRGAVSRHLDVHASRSQAEDIARLILKALREGQPIRMRRSEALSLVAQAVRKGEIAVPELSSSWQKAMDRLL